METAFFQNENILIQVEWNIKQGIRYKLESFSSSTGSPGAALIHLKFFFSENLII